MTGLAEVVDFNSECICEVDAWIFVSGKRHNIKAAGRKLRFLEELDSFGLRE